MLQETLREKRAWRALAAAAALSLGTDGCYKATVADTHAPGWDDAPRESRWESYFLWGLVGRNEEDVRTICPQGRAVLVRQDSGFLTYLVGTVSLGIYAPRNLVVGCEPVRAASVAAGQPKRTP